MYKEPNKSFGQFGRKGKKITQEELNALAPQEWLIATNQTTDQWHDRFDRKYANIYWDNDKKALRGLIYATFKESSPWTQRDDITLYFDDYLLKAKDLKDYRSHMGSSYKGKWSSKWKPRWRIFWVRTQEGSGCKIDNATDVLSHNGKITTNGVKSGKLAYYPLDVKNGRAKMSDIFRFAKQDPYYFLDPNLVDYGLLNMRFFR